MPHGSSGAFSPASVRAYAQTAEAVGLSEIAITEHLYRFPDVQDALGPWWEDDPDPRLRAHIASYFSHERLSQSLAEYVEVVLEAAGQLGDGDGDVAVRLGLEVDLFAGRMAEVVDLLAPHPWDVLLGAVHWLGAWGFDQWGDAEVEAEWSRRRPEDVWLAYVDAVEEMAASGACDVLAHVDLPKGDGVRAGAAEEECDERLVKVAAANRLGIEVSTAGWRKPVSEAYPGPDLLRKFRAAVVPITLASDAHERSVVGHRIADASSLATAAGYREVALFERRRSRALPLSEDGG